MSGKNSAASRIVKGMREEGSALNGFEMTQAVVTSVNPIGISYNNVRISEGVILSGCLQTVTELESVIDSEAEISQGFKNALKELIKAIQLSVNDRVIVQRVKNTFYIVGKVDP